MQSSSENSFSHCFTNPTTSRTGPPSSCRMTVGASRQARRRATVDTARMDHRRRQAIVFTDIQGFTTRMREDESTTVRVVREHRELVRDALARFGGREVRTVGDAFLLLFDGP